MVYGLVTRLSAVEGIPRASEGASGPQVADGVSGGPVASWQTSFMPRASPPPAAMGRLLPCTRRGRSPCTLLNRLSLRLVAEAQIPRGQSWAESFK